MNSIMKGEEMRERACFSFTKCFSSLDLIVSCFEIDLRAKKCYFAVSVTRKTLPNWPYPSFLATWKSYR